MRHDIQFLRGFAVLANTSDKIQSPRGYLLRIATNLWIDRTRRAAREPLGAEADREPAGGPGADAGVQVREAGAVLLGRLAPRERAAVLLKDVFDCTLEETADVLGSTVGAVKSALHRGRARLAKEEPVTSDDRPPPVPVELVDRFVEAFNRGDRPALVEMMLDNATTDVFCAGLGPDPARQWLRATLEGHLDWPASHQWERQRAERGVFGGEPIVLLFRTKGGVEAFEELWRFEQEEGRVSWVRDYSFCPETLAVVAEHFGLTLRTNGYRCP